MTSPDFLLHTDQGAGSGDHAVASRLSYFLWGSMPDDELFALARRGALTEPATLAAQARRLLACRAPRTSSPTSARSGWRWTSSALRST